jgi:N-acetylneuraminic acid mutarotase
MKISKKSIWLLNNSFFVHHESAQKSLRRPIELNKKLKQTLSHNIEQLKKIFPMKAIKVLLYLIVFSPILRAQSWVARPDFPGTGRSAGVAFTIGNISYVGTGSGNNDFYAFDGTTNTWSLALTAFPGATNNNVAFAINGKGYVGMGGNGNLFYEYDPVANSWTPKANFPGISNFLGVAFAIGNKGYFRSGDAAAMASNTSFYEYNPITDIWTQKTDLGVVLRSAAAFSIDGKGYIGTGLDGASLTTTAFYEYDPTGNSGMGTWTQKANFGGSGRFNTVSFSTSTQGYIGLGSDANGTGQEFWIYTPSSNSWAKLAANFPTASRSQAVGFVINDRPFVSLGNDGVLQKNLYEFDPLVVLSVELTQFSAVMNKGKSQIAINWTTATERDNAYFAVERKGSLEEDFREIGRIKGKGNSAQNVLYNLLDNQPLQGIAYYRLSSVDNKGEKTYSQTVSVTYEKGGKIVVFPSNTEGPLTVDVGSQRIDETNVFSTTGQLMLHGNQNQIDLSILPRGLYFIQIKTANEIAIQKVFKQ